MNGPKDKKINEYARSLRSEKWHRQTEIVCECSKLAKNSIRLGTTAQEIGSTKNYAKHWILTIPPNGIGHKPESVVENEMHKVLWDFEIQTDHLSLARRPDLILINKKKKKRK